MMKRLRQPLLRPCLLVPLLALAGAAQAQQQLTFAQQRASTAASITGNGRLIAFHSSAPLVPPAASGSDAFVVDADGSGLTRLTGNQLQVRAPVIAADGSIVVFVSNGNPTGANPDGNTELFAVKPDSGVVTQITDTGASNIRAPSLSADGSRIAFTATGDLLQDGRAPPGTSRDVFVIGADGDNLVQITQGAVGTVSKFPDISPHGNRVVFSSNANFDGANADGSSEIFVATTDGSGTPEQLTDARTGRSRRPSLADNGLIAFESNAALDGPNPGGNFEIFVVRVDGGTPPRQITSTQAGKSTHPVIARTGFRVAFQSSANLIGNNRDNSVEIFIATTDGSDIDQLTEANRDSTRPDISASGERVVFQSSANLTGNNPTFNTEIFVIDPRPSTINGSEDNDESLFCSEGSGCVLCFDEDDDPDRPADPTLALLVILAGLRMTRRRR